MRKLLYTLAGLSALALMASCNKEAERPASPEGEVVTATFTVAAPEGVATKAAIGDGTQATELIVAVYDEQKNYLQALSESAVKSRDGLIWTVSMKVIKDMTYQFVFLAKKEADVNAGFCHFDAANAKISIDYSAVPANSDAADFFFVQDKFKVENSFSKTEEMHRPLAQVNFGASDLAAAAYSIKTDDTMLTGVTLTRIHSEMDVLTGDVTSTAADVTFTQAARVPTEDPKFVDGYDRIAMVYALVAKNQANVSATLNVTAKGAQNDVDHTITRVITNVPLKRNYRTNILGNIFTNDFNFTVNTVPGFYTPDSNKLIGPSFASVADLNAYFATFTDNADNGDVTPEEVTLTASAAGETICLPQYAGSVRIFITAKCEGTVTLAYPASATVKPSTVELYAFDITELAGDITATHLTILESSHIGTTNCSTSDTTLEIRPTATVGTVKIVKGNANIQGNVANVEVPSSATAVAGTSVQVFVSKEAAIETITLNAKADVVVEQPQNNIDVTDTDKKVQVIVNAAGSSATAQNGGQIYVIANANCVVTATNDNEHSAEETSIYVAEVTNSATVAAVEENNGDVTSSSSASTAVVENGVVSINNVSFYKTVKAAIEAAKDGDTLKLLKDFDARNDGMYDSYRVYNIAKSITFDGNGHTLTVKGRGIAVGALASSNVDVTFKDITILNSASGARCIDTRGHIGTLTLDGVTLSTQKASGVTQPLTIGGNQSDRATINISNSIIETNEDAVAYYAIITFNPVLMNINNSSLRGWACIYAKGIDSSAGSAGSEFIIDNCSLESTNIYGGQSNAFAMFTVEDENVTFKVTNSRLAVKGSSDQYQAIILTKKDNVVANLGSGNNVTLTGKGVYVLNSKSLCVTGGTFTIENSEDWLGEYVLEGYGVYTNDNMASLSVFKLGDAPEGYNLVTGPIGGEDPEGDGPLGD